MKKQIILLASCVALLGAGCSRPATTPYDYATWAVEQFGTNASNPAIAGEIADPDADGAINRIEYAFGGQAMIADCPPSVLHTVDSDDFRISFSRPSDRGGVAYLVEQATSLAGPWTNAGVVESRQNPDGTETVAVHCTSAIGEEPVQSLRLRVSMQ